MSILVQTLLRVLRGKRRGPGERGRTEAPEDGGRPGDSGGKLGGRREGERDRDDRRRS
ncbi:MAG TPA: hypothetical protein PKB11_08995 [Desulfovibrio sp.]|jgi:hypothetical protein|uniref:hypothetical protein n=1 Tax=Desulfovibrio sp. TaxID=885 RepID=UPI002A3A7564|nr:hypothetical protein [Desulfovibrio sp.]MDY0306314.1 hypothetical protein [Desulfovibrionaceae bacterium]HMM38881.1 hypothetical protein [Desulfovibrio sp.]